MKDGLIEEEEFRERVEDLSNIMEYMRAFDS